MRIGIIFGLAGMWVLCCGCAKRVAAIPVKAVPASQAVFARQVREARIAGEGNQEIKVLRQRLAVEPGSIELRMELAKHYENAGYPDLALEHVRLARNFDGSSAHLMIEEARLLMKQDLPEQAAKVLRAAAEAPGAAAEIHSWMGIALDEAGDLAGGEAAHRRALALAPDDDTILNNLGYNLYRQGRPEEAIRYLEAAVAQNRGNALARSNLARAMVTRAAAPDAAGAVAHWSAAVDPASAHNNLAAALIEQGSYEQARRELNAALAIERKHIAAWHNLRLVSELDGQPATVLAVRRTGPWQRFADFWKHAFGGGKPPGETNESPSQRASR